MCMFLLFFMYIHIHVFHLLPNVCFQSFKRTFHAPFSCLRSLLLSESGFADFGLEAGRLSTSDGAGFIVVGKISAHSDRTYQLPLFQYQDTTKPALWLYCLPCHQGIATRIHQNFCGATDTLFALYVWLSVKSVETVKSVKTVSVEGRRFDCQTVLPPCESSPVASSSASHRFVRLLRASCFKN